MTGDPISYPSITNSDAAVKALCDIRAAIGAPSTVSRLLLEAYRQGVDLPALLDAEFALHCVDQSARLDS